LIFKLVRFGSPTRRTNRTPCEVEPLLNDILLQVKRLNKEDQLNLLEKLALLIRKSEHKENKTKLTSISGVGSSLWSNTGIDGYIDQERQW
jgi:hypothetical protein